MSAPPAREVPVFVLTGWISVSSAAARLGVTKQTIRNMYNAGTLQNMYRLANDEDSRNGDSERSTYVLVVSKDEIDQLVWANQEQQRLAQQQEHQEALRREAYTRVRQWGRENGFQVSDQGRPTRKLCLAYLRVHPEDADLVVPPGPPLALDRLDTQNRDSGHVMYRQPSPDE